jgi:CDP-paratose 2-epimerase
VIFLSTSRVYPIKLLNELRLAETDTRFVLEVDDDVPGISRNGFSEQLSLEGTRSLYGTTKLSSELIIQEYGEMYGIRSIINRCGVLTGPWQMGKVDQGVVVLWLAMHLFGGELSYLGYGGSGKQVRDILHVDDLFRLISMQYEQVDLHNGKVYNVGGGNERSVSLCELTELCRTVTGKIIDINSVATTRAADIPYYVTDTAKVCGATAWTPQISLEQTIEEIAAWLAENKSMLQHILT